MSINMEELIAKGHAKKEEKHEKSIADVIDFIKVSIKDAICDDKNHFEIDLDKYNLAKTRNLIKDEWYCYKVKIGYKYKMVVYFRNCHSEKIKNRKSMFIDLAFATFLSCTIGAFGFVLFNLK